MSAEYSSCLSPTNILNATRSPVYPNLLRDVFGDFPSEVLLQESVPFNVHQEANPESATLTDDFASSPLANDFPFQTHEVDTHEVSAQPLQSLSTATSVEIPAKKSNRGRKAKGYQGMMHLDVAYPSAFQLRSTFRKFFQTLNPCNDSASALLEQLRFKLSAKEFEALLDFLAQKQCTYAYKSTKTAGYVKRAKKPDDNKSESLASRLCYKVNQGAVDEFMKRKELNFAFFCAVDEIVKRLAAENADNEAISAAQTLKRICVTYAATLRFE